MNITQESTGALTAKVCINIEKEDYAEKVDQKLREHRKKMKMPGFREGNVPLGMVKKMYGKAILAEEINQMISEGLYKHIDENEIKTLMSPIPAENQEPMDFDVAESVSFCFDIALKPEVNIDFENIKGIIRYQPTADEKSVDEYIDHLRKSYGTFETADEANEESMVTVSFTELNDAGEPFQGNITCENDFLVSKIVDKTIKEQILGARVDSTIRMNPMKAFENRTEVAAMLKIKTEELSDPVNDFEITIKSISNRKPSEINADFLAEVFPSDQLENEDQLRERVAEDIAQSYQREADNMMVNDALEKLLNITDLDLPDEFLKRWLLLNADEGSITTEDIENQYEEYARQIRVTLIRNYLIEENKITVTAPEMMEYISRAIGIKVSDDEDEKQLQMQMLQNVYQKVMEDQKQSEQIRESILEQKLTDLLLEKTPHEMTSVQLDELNKIIKERNEKRKQEKE